ncbi:unnamed protein product [Lactuca saligna]|uniref:Uncharacterized protein n=1 Tax=Lactuca saligna TaxID=75948 RepID=A0AA35ZKV0_LACSI|nr:unnamed protein product [Lactuca saligna]
MWPYLSNANPIQTLALNDTLQPATSKHRSPFPLPYFNLQRRQWGRRVHRRITVAAGNDVKGRLLTLSDVLLPPFRLVHVRVAASAYNRRCNAGIAVLPSNATTSTPFLSMMMDVDVAINKDRAGTIFGRCCCCCSPAETANPSRHPR